MYTYAIHLFYEVVFSYLCILYSCNYYKINATEIEIFTNCSVPTNNDRDTVQKTLSQEINHCWAKYGTENIGSVSPYHRAFGMPRSRTSEKGRRTYPGGPPKDCPNLQHPPRRARALRTIAISFLYVHHDETLLIVLYYLLLQVRGETYERILLSTRDVFRCFAPLQVRQTNARPQPELF